MDLRKDLKQLRLDKGWSQHRLADESGVSRATIARIEAGENVSVETLAKIAAVLAFVSEKPAGSLAPLMNRWGRSGF